jgi:hypothetical protein
MEFTDQRAGTLEAMRKQGRFSLFQGVVTNDLCVLCEYRKTESVFCLSHPAYAHFRIESGNAGKKFFDFRRSAPRRGSQGFHQLRVAGEAHEIVVTCPPYNLSPAREGINDCAITQRSHTIAACLERRR